MSMNDLEQGLALVAAHPSEAFFEGAKSIQLIASAELALGIEFPPTYRRFLERLGCGSFGGEEFYGLIGEEFQESSIPNGVWATLSLRRQGLPSSLIVVGSGGDGSNIVLATSRRSDKGECPVVVWWGGDEDSDELEIVAEDFGQYFRCLVEEVLQD